jgi:hypothetical protein
MNFLSQLMGGLGGLGGGQMPQQPQQPEAGAPMQLPSAAPGGLAGLLGMMGGPNGFAGNAMQAAGRSLMTSPRNNPMAGFGKAMGDVQQSGAANAQRQMLIQMLKQAGFSDEEAASYASNPQLAQMAMQQRGMKPGG